MAARSLNWAEEDARPDTPTRSCWLRKLRRISLPLPELRSDKLATLAPSDPVTPHRTRRARGRRSSAPIPPTRLCGRRVGTGASLPRGQHDTRTGSARVHRGALANRPLVLGSTGQHFVQRPGTLYPRFEVGMPDDGNLIRMVDLGSSGQGEVLRDEGCSSSPFVMFGWLRT